MTRDPRWFRPSLESDDIDQFEEPWPPEIYGAADWSELDTGVEYTIGRGATSGVE